MYRRVLAFDYDGTLAENGRVPPALQQALENLHLAGYALFLVTGRRFESVDLGSLGEIFTGIAWENGAVLQHIALHELYLPFGHVDARLVKALEEAGVPLEHGLAIVATWTPYEETVWRVLGETGSDAAIVHNKGALMVLPPGAAKGSGLARLLELCGYSPRNLVTFGDGENDLSLFQISETSVAVADAVPSLIEAADLVMSRPGSDGVLAALETYWLSGRSPDMPRRPEHSILLGTDETGAPVSLAGAMLASSNLGVFGDSGSGKEK
jgi:hydroxymethylpyrimidine pyrophosphatase-like HAD family hydrolase